MRLGKLLRTWLRWEGGAQKVVGEKFPKTIYGLPWMDSIEFHTSPSSAMEYSAAGSKELGVYELVSVERATKRVTLDREVIR